MKYLIVVDMQNDFVDGALGTEEAEKIVPGVAEKIRHFDGRILYTKDTHENNYLETAEGKKLPVAHCIHGTKGWELVPEIQKLAEAAGTSEGANEIEKPTFGSVELGKLLAREPQTGACRHESLPDRGHKRGVIWYVDAKTDISDPYADADRGHGNLTCISDFSHPMQTAN